MKSETRTLGQVCKAYLGLKMKWPKMHKVEFLKLWQGGVIFKCYIKTEPK